MLQLLHKVCNAYILAKALELESGRQQVTVLVRELLSVSLWVFYCQNQNLSLDGHQIENGGNFPHFKLAVLVTVELAEKVLGRVLNFFSTHFQDVIEGQLYLIGVLALHKELDGLTRVHCTKISKSATHACVHEVRL